MKKLRLAVTGLSHAGKTVFLTSMINFLLENGSEHSALFRRNGLMVSAKELPLDKTINRFPYEDYLRGFKKKPPQWPEPTKKESEFHLKLMLRKRKKAREYRLELVDYPGEQIIDLPLWENTYETWSDETVRALKVGIRGSLSQEFRQACKTLSDHSPQNVTQKKNAIEEYRRYLSKCKKKELNFLQPSKMLLEDLNDENLAFCPLGKKTRETIPSTTADFKKQFKAYRSKNVLDFALELLQCRRQIVLVDILQILKNGVPVYNDAVRCFDCILDTYRYKRYWRFIESMLSFFSNKVSVERVAFVATKADQATRANRYNMKALLEELVTKKHGYLRSSTKADVRFFFGAANRSTKDKKAIYQGRELSVLAGRPKKMNVAKERLIYPGEVPSQWPNKWEPDEEAYRFPEFLPELLPPRNGVIFGHINLDEVLLYVFEDLV